MNIFEKLDNKKLPEVNNGSAKDVPDFFDEIIKQQFSNKDAIVEIHKEILKYLNSDSPTFFVRLYGSFEKNKYDEQRRGFVSKYQDGTRVVFCDNTFTLLFTGMKLAGIPFRDEDLKQLFSQKKLIVGFGQVSQEKELSFYTTKGAKRAYLNKKGWYQAHIKPVGKNYQDLNLRELFPNPKREDFNTTTKERIVNSKLTPQQFKLLKAHFIRLIHPFNSFLVPNKNRIEYIGSENKQNIGEENELINHVKEYLQNTFPQEYKEFDELSIKIDFEESQTSISNIKWSSKVKATTPLKPIIKESSDNIEENQEFKLEKTLRSIGKTAFASILYPELLKNINIKHEEIAKKHPIYNSYSITSQKNRLSRAKGLFKKGLEEEALSNILYSKEIKDEKLKTSILKHIKTD